MLEFILSADILSATSYILSTIATVFIAFAAALVVACVALLLLSVVVDLIPVRGGVDHVMFARMNILGGQALTFFIIGAIAFTSNLILF